MFLFSFSVFESSEDRVHMSAWGKAVDTVRRPQEGDVIQDILPGDFVSNKFCISVEEDVVCSKMIAGPNWYVQNHSWCIECTKAVQPDGFRKISPDDFLGFYRLVWKEIEDSKSPDLLEKF